MIFSESFTSLIENGTFFLHSLKKIAKILTWQLKGTVSTLIDTTTQEVIKMIIKTSVQTTVQLIISLSRMKVLFIMTHIFAIDFHESLDYYDPNNYRS